MRRSFFLMVLSAITFTPAIAQDLGSDSLEHSSFGVASTSTENAAAAFQTRNRQMPTQTGVILLHVDKNGPAGKAGLQSLDVVTKIGEKTIKTQDDFSAAIRSLKANSPVTVSSFRSVKHESGDEHWKNCSIKVTPCSRRQLIQDCLKKDVDKNIGSTVTRHKDSSSSDYEHDELFLYIVESKAGDVTLRMKIVYVGREWLFIQEYLLSTANERFELKPTTSETIERDIGVDKAWETCDWAIDESRRKMLDSILAVDKNDLRYVGRKAAHDRILTISERYRMQMLLDAYEIMTVK